MSAYSQRPASLSGCDDVVTSFSLQGRSVKGRAVRLGEDSLDKLLSKHNVPDMVKFAMAEVTALVCLIGASLKDDSAISIQLQGTESPLSLLLAEYHVEKGIRVTSTLNESQLGEGCWADKWRLTPRELLSDTGIMALTIHTGKASTGQYQGLVPLVGTSFSECVEHYFSASEQIPTAVRCAVGKVSTKNEPDKWRSGGIFLQQIADHTRSNEAAIADWEHGFALFSTLEDEELVDETLDLEQLLLRLYHEEGVRVYGHQNIATFCTCSRQKLFDILNQYDRETRFSVAQDNMISAKCDFCNEDYFFKLSDFA